MLQIGIRLHDVNGKEPAELQTLEARAAKAKEEGFCCVHLALSKVIKGVTWDAAALTEGYKNEPFLQRATIVSPSLSAARPDSPL